MKKVVSNLQACHLWANQSQSEARGPSIFFRDSMIFSYGEHYLMGKIHFVKGKRGFALINSRGYSVTTAKHTSYVWRALRDNLLGFYCSDPRDTKLAVKENDARIETAIDRCMRVRKVTSKEEIGFALETIREAVKTANDLRGYLKRAKISAKASDVAKVRAHLQKRLARYQELNPPHVIAARKAEKEAKERAWALERQASLMEQVEKFRQGEVSTVWGLPYEALRISEKEGTRFIQTSAGAEVPLDEAKTLFELIQSEPLFKLQGHEIGGFKLTSVDQTDTDKVIRIGCHKILFSEAYRVLGGAA